MKRPYSEEEDELLRWCYEDTTNAELAWLLDRRIQAVAYRAKKLGLHKSVEYLLATGRTADGFIAPGSTPPNKGKRMPGWAPGRMGETQFKPGRRPRIPVGGHRVDGEGFLLRRVSDDGYNDWKYEHRLLWEETFGPIPRGHHLRFKDGDRKHVAIDNLELMSQAEMMRRNSIHNLPPEVVEVVQLRGTLNRMLRRRTREKQND